jgi:hypothetical protein
VRIYIKNAYGFTGISSEYNINPRLSNAIIGSFVPQDDKLKDVIFDDDK